MALIGKLAGKAFSKTAAKAAPKVALSLSEELAQQASETAPAKVPLVARKKASKALKAEEPTQPPAKAPAASEAVAEDGVMLSLSEQMAKRESLAAQTEEALPPPTAPESAYNFPNKAFSDEDYAAAEAYLKDNNTANVFNAKKLDDEAFANELQSTAAWLKGIPYKEQPPLPYKPKEFTPSEEVGADFKAKPMVDVEDVPDPQVKPELLSGDLNKVSSEDNVRKRDRALEGIRKYREYNYSRIKRMPDTEAFDDAVIGVAQGEFRAKYGREVDVAVRKDQRLLTRLLKSKQEELDGLRRKYKNVPDKVLYHGNNPEAIAIVKSEGFARPSTFMGGGHDELKVGAPSLTSDLSLNLKSTRFGGKDAENYVSYKLPYAEYMFSRVNMTPKEYEAKDLNTIAKTITGTPRQTRPLSLPRMEMYETESAMPEMDKLRRRPDVQTRADVEEKIPQYEQYRDRQKKAGETLTDLMRSTKTEMDQKQALQTYAATREYLNAISNMGKLTSVKTGMGQSYNAALNMLYDRTPLIKKAAETLRQNKATEKADNMDVLYKALQDVNNNDTKAAGRVIGITSKFNRGGLVSRK
jgi:hypothetical protein